MDALPTEQIQNVLAAYAVTPAQIRAVDTGLINKTYRVTDSKGLDYILQQVNSRFPPEINLDIDIVTRHLQQSGLLAPRLLPDSRGMVYLCVDGWVWRLFNHISGSVYERLEHSDMARAAGAMLGRVHSALALLDYELQTDQPAAHDTPLHALRLKNSLTERRSHSRHALVKPLGEAILARLDQLPALPEVAARMVHGDPKISNFIFSNDGREALCMVDFDTLNRMPIYLELGDALRSWCNPAGEDSTDAYFSIPHCRAALVAYFHHAGELLTREEWLAVPAATLTIYLELAARFCADALNEDYFSWDPKRFGSHSEHSEIRAKGQFNAANSLLDQYASFTEAVNQMLR